MFNYGRKKATKQRCTMVDSGYYDSMLHKSKAFFRSNTELNVAQGLVGKVGTVLFLPHYRCSHLKFPLPVDWQPTPSQRPSPPGFLVSDQSFFGHSHSSIFSQGLMNLLHLPSATKCSGTWRVTLTVGGQESCVA